MNHNGSVRGSHPLWLSEAPRCSPPRSEGVVSPRTPVINRRKGEERRSVSSLLPLLCRSHNEMFPHAEQNHTAKRRRHLHLDEVANFVASHQ
ncbi:hypothetical protein F2P81_019592 [Scophthalmus maximus]|uniref:Uncharacterized protein n=1 Tax=Scophthalmus maximus TaxID=52904 RepID=A0A6A4S882_SCOMX|nr:hypothetical protein F2P81_019592 [Scophthalmus maximus]